MMNFVWVHFPFSFVYILCLCTPVPACPALKMFGSFREYEMTVGKTAKSSRAYSSSLQPTRIQPPSHHILLFGP
ncbi:hypothetical protein QBC38DRAFT_489820 [Podospora fimiseda]|uniref:Secreted protein n=1 Tax=Podospora fimiseda TaxID=252190 RepID=A0AAN6YNC4_9PEZI|nr:hypothetical protein QBC38DRAFT_489820 [Podospora fimiseda]